eukprot:jgi/Chlat1/8759/Chrsp9S08565
MADRSAGGEEGTATAPAGPVPSRHDVVIYTTSFRTVRKVFEECTKARLLLEAHRVPFDERDTAMSIDFREELKARTGGTATVPQIFIRDQHIGGLEELEDLNEEGELQKLLEGIERGGASALRHCDECGGKRFMLCGECHGSRKVQVLAGDVQQCGSCNENGLRRCITCG